MSEQMLPSFTNTALKERILALVQLVGSMICLQFGSSLAKSLFPLFGAGGMVGLRTAFAAIALVLFFRSWHVISLRTMRLVMPYGTAIAGMNLCFYLALQRIPLGMTVAIEFTGPLFLAFIGSRRPADVGWIVLTVLGLCMLLRPDTAALPDILGVLYAVGAAICWALYIIFGKRLTGKLSPGHACALGLLCSAIILFLPCFAPAFWVGLHHPFLLGMAVLVALSSSALPYALEMQAMHRLSARDLGVLYSLEPVCAACAGILLLHETLSLLRMAGILCIVLASAGTVLTPGKKRLVSELPELPQ
nr:EamA family transporter [uncultured Acetobacter sp.]